MYEKPIADRSSGILKVRCPHCGEVVDFPEFASIDVFICPYCEESVEVEEPRQ
jgi:endogenous inhibitor of DNA gyrase (YacG/DUF329 family)